MFAIGTPSGPVRAYILGESPAEAANQLQSGEVVVSVDTIPSTPQIVSDDGKSLTAFVPPLADLQAARWNDARDYRDSIANGSCATPSGTVQTDDASKLRINGAVAMAMLAKSAGSALSIVWTLNDNTTVTLDADSMIGVGVAVGQFVAACQNAGTAIRAQIDAATYAASLAAINIEAGYP